MRRSTGSSAVSTRSKDSPEHTNKKLSSLEPITRSSCLSKDEEGNLIYKRRGAVSHNTDVGLSVTVASLRKTAAENTNAATIEPEVELPPTLVKKKRTIVRTEDTIRECDAYCWMCHGESEGNDHLCCNLCPRLYHKKCLSLDAFINDWTCPECQKIMKAECTATRSKAMQMMTIDHFCSLLRQALERSKCVGCEPFLKPVDLVAVPSYLDYIAHPMDLSTMEKNIRKKLYGSTEAFLADCKWILHNCIVFNGYVHELTTVAKMILKIAQHELSELEICPDCYTSSCMQNNAEWFCEPCRTPHPLVWAKMRSFPYWPAKALRVVNGQVDCRFFGAHDRAWVPLSQVFLLSKEPPVPLKQKKGGYQQSIEESKIHIQKLREKFGGFEYAPTATPYDLTHPLRCKKSVQQKSENSNLTATSKDSLIRSGDNKKKVENKTSQLPSPTRNLTFGMLKMRVRHAADRKPTSIASATAFALRSRYHKMNKRAQAVRPNEETGAEGEKQPIVSEPLKAISAQQEDSLKTALPHVNCASIDSLKNSTNSLSKKSILFAKFDAIFNQALSDEQKVDNNCSRANVDECVKFNNVNASSDIKPFSESDEVIGSLSPVFPVEKSHNQLVNRVTEQCDCNPGDYREPTITQSSPKSVDHKEDACSLDEPSNTCKSNCSAIPQPPGGSKRNMFLDTLVAACKAKLGLPAVGDAENECCEILESSSDSDNDDENHRTVPSTTEISSINSNTDDKILVQDHAEQSKDCQHSSNNEDPLKAESGNVQVLSSDPLSSSDIHHQVLSTSVPIVQQSQSPLSGEPLCGLVKNLNGLVNTDISTDSHALSNLSVNETVSKCNVSKPSLASAETMCVENTATVELSPTDCLRKLSATTIVNVAANKTIVDSANSLTSTNCHRPCSSPLCMGEEDSSNDSCALVIDLDSDRNGDTVSSNKQQKSSKSKQARKPEKRKSKTDSPIPSKRITIDQVSSSTSSSSTTPVTPETAVIEIDGAEFPKDALSLTDRSRSAVSNMRVTYSGVHFDLHKYISKVENSVNQALLGLFNDFILQGAAEGIKNQLQKEVDRLEQLHELQLKEIRHNTELRIKEMKTLLLREKEEAKASLMREKEETLAAIRKQTEQEKATAVQQAIQETKKKPWCANCWKEAQFYCCWNTSYCGYECQQAHWPDHMSTCTQTTASSSSGGNSTQPATTSHSGPIPLVDQSSSSSLLLTGNKSGDWYQEKGRSPLSSPPIKTPRPPATSYRAIAVSTTAMSYSSGLAPSPNLQSFSLSNGSQVQYLPAASNTMIQSGNAMAQPGNAMVQPGNYSTYRVPIGQLQMTPMPPVQQVNSVRGSRNTLIMPQTQQYVYTQYPRQIAPAVTQAHNMQMGGYPTTNFRNRQY